MGAADTRVSGEAGGAADANVQRQQQGQAQVGTIIVDVT
jgi:hypothetical protein